MVVLITCKNEEDPIKNEGARVFTTLYINFSDAHGQITLELVVVVLGFYDSPTAKVIRRWDLGLKSRPKDWRSPGSNSRPLD